jgi:hypothetical protein
MSDGVQNGQHRPDNFSAFTRRALEGREDFWLLRLLYPVRRSDDSRRRADRSSAADHHRSPAATASPGRGRARPSAGAPRQDPVAPRE